MRLSSCMILPIEVVCKLHDAGLGREISGARASVGRLCQCHRQCKVEKYRRYVWDDGISPRSVSASYNIFQVEASPCFRL